MRHMAPWFLLALLAPFAADRSIVQAATDSAQTWRRCGGSVVNEAEHK